MPQTLQVSHHLRIPHQESAQKPQWNYFRNNVDFFIFLDVQFHRMPGVAFWLAHDCVYSQNKEGPTSPQRGTQ